MGPGGDVARVSALRAGLGADVPGVTVDRQCGSGLDAVMQAAVARAGRRRPARARRRRGVRVDGAAPVVARRPASGTRVRRSRPPASPTPTWARPPTGSPRSLGISRARQDAWAARSHARAAAAQDAGVFDAEIVAVDGVARDDRPRAAMDLARLARFAPAFA